MGEGLGVRGRQVNRLDQSLNFFAPTNPSADLAFLFAVTLDPPHVTLPLEATRKRNGPRRSDSNISFPRLIALTPIQLS